eukprot:233683_1
MLTLVALLSCILHTISGERSASEICNHFLGAPVGNCDSATESGRYFGLFCVDSKTIQAQSFTDIDCSEDMIPFGPEHDCVAPYCNCNGTSASDACPLTSITGTPCPDFVDVEDRHMEKWTHIRDVCVTTPNLNTSVQSTCSDGNTVYMTYDHHACEGEGSVVSCVGEESCDICEDWVVFE